MYLKITNSDQEDEEDPIIHIEDSWAEFYFKSLNDPRLKPDPPSVEQIE